VGPRAILGAEGSRIGLDAVAKIKITSPRWESNLEPPDRQARSLVYIIRPTMNKWSKLVAKINI